VREDETTGIEGRLLAKAIPFEQPSPQQIQIVQKENSSCSVM
jgi:hypothetical protein